MATIKQIDEAMAVYYKRFKRPYLNSDNKGLFRLWCKDQGFEDDDIKEEINCGAHDCTLIEFDVDPNDPTNNLFPLENPTNNEAQRNVEIFKILKYCYQHSAAPLPTTHLVDINAPNFFDINKKIQKKNIKLYRDTLTVLLRGGDDDLLNFLAIGYTQRVPLLSYLVDSYSRDYVQYFIKNKKVININQWCQHQDNIFMQTLRENGKIDLAKGLQMAIQSYVNRIRPKFQLKPLYLVDDKIQEIATFIVAVPKFIKSLIKSSAAHPKFQVDVLVAVHRVKDATHTHNGSIAIDDDKDSASDDSDSDADDDINDPIGPKKMYVTNDYIGNLQDKLAGVQCGYFPRHDYSHGDDIYKDEIDGLYRFLGKRYQNFRTYLDQKRRKNISKINLNNNTNDDIDDDDVKSNNNDPINPNNSAKKPKIKTKKDQHNFHGATYPQNKRFCLFMDRRSGSDKIMFFEPPAVCDTMPNENITEWYHESVRRCLIPRKDFSDNIIEEQKHNKSPLTNDDDKTITSIDGICGQLMTFSYQVDQVDEIRCYIIWNGQTMRFHGEYITQVLPLIFVDSPENELFKNDIQAKRIEKMFNNELRDARFEEIYTQVSQFNLVHKKHF